MSIAVAMIAAVALGVEHWSIEHQPIPLASQPVKLSGAGRVTVYFGQLGPLWEHEAGRVYFNIAPDAVGSMSEHCALTVVAEGVSGTKASLSASGLGPDWDALEGLPEQHVSATGGVIHQQLIAPKAAIAVGSTYQASVVASVDGRSILSSTYSLRLRSRDADTEVWTLGTSRDIECTTPAQ